MLSNAYFLAKFRFDTAENEPAKNLQKIAKFANFADPKVFAGVVPTILAPVWDPLGREYGYRGMGEKCPSLFFSCCLKYPLAWRDISSGAPWLLFSIRYSLAP